MADTSLTLVALTQIRWHVLRCGRISLVDSFASLTPQFVSRCTYNVIKRCIRQKRRSCEYNCIFYHIQLHFQTKEQDIGIKVSLINVILIMLYLSYTHRIQTINGMWETFLIIVKQCVYYVCVTYFLSVWIVSSWNFARNRENVESSICYQTMAYCLFSIGCFCTS